MLKGRNFPQAAESTYVPPQKVVKVLELCQSWVYSYTILTGRDKIEIELRAVLNPSSSIKLIVIIQYHVRGNSDEKNPECVVRLSERWNL